MADRPIPSLSARVREAREPRGGLRSAVAAVAPSANRRSNAGPAILRRYSDAYSSFVGLMKYALPVAAFLLVAAVVMWPQIRKTENSIRRTFLTALTPDDVENVRIVRPRYVGVDDRRQPYMLSAEVARQTDPQADLVSLSAPKADLTLSDGTWLALTAKNGAYRQKNRMLDLYGQVSIFHDGGYSVETEEAHIDFRAGLAYGDRPVVAHGPLGTLESEGFQVLDRGRTFRFTGPARLVIYAGDGLAAPLRGLGRGVTPTAADAERKP